MYQASSHAVLAVTSFYAARIKRAAHGVVAEGPHLQAARSTERFVQPGQGTAARVGLLCSISCLLDTQQLKNKEESILK